MFIVSNFLIGNIFPRNEKIVFLFFPQPAFLQYIRHPGGATDPLTLGRGQHLTDATVLGLRTVVKFWARPRISHNRARDREAYLQ
jgi:hypothetical protein